MGYYNVLAKDPEKTFTVPEKYEYVKPSITAYESEEMLEKRFVNKLISQGYTYLDIKTNDDLVKNLRTQIEKLNDITFNDDEWNRFYITNISNDKLGIVEKTRIIQKDNIIPFKFDNGTLLNIRIIDKKHISNNIVQVINQYAVDSTVNKTRYDVTILVNGLPLVHIELKRRGVLLKQAFNQINRYQKESFWAESGLFEFVQIFVISNGTFTKYYSNTTREMAVKFATKTKTIKTANAYEFTSYWSDRRNVRINDLMDFTESFFEKHTLLKIITKFCNLNCDNTLMVSRPYQIAGAESIITKTEYCTNAKIFSCPEAGGYIHHTTGSGKTFTSFLTTKLLGNFEELDIDKIIFAVDRKDLDIQTITEYERFQKGCVSGNTSTKQLKEQLEKKDSKVVITTIQKLNQFVKDEKAHPIYNKHIVFIFDECHRSQFGSSHKAIAKAFKKYHMFGFTGTPIYAKNKSTSAIDKDVSTTEAVFGQKLHSYTIVDAIKDENVLSFKIDYVDTFKISEKLKDENLEDIDKDAIIYNAVRIHNNTKYILDKYDQKTKRKEHYTLDGKVMQGFNSLFATESIKMDILYYKELKKQIAQRKPGESGYGLKVATIFSFGANDDEESFDVEGLEQSHKEELQYAINDYNEMFGTSFSLSGDGFYNYYQDLTRRIKNNELDIVIVVNMLLTGFDSKVTNTLWVDKNMQMHGLLQAFSRTNRILNAIKAYGQIVCFRDLRDKVDEALALYGDEYAKGIVLLRTYDDYINGYKDANGKKHKGYKELVNEILTTFPFEEEIVGESNQKKFIKLFSDILRLFNILVSFDEFAKDKETILSSFDMANYQSIYLDLKDRFNILEKDAKTNVLDDIVFETELVEHIAVNIDYILHLVEKYHKTQCKDKDIISQITTAIMSSPELRSKRVLIEKFYKQINIGDDISNDWLIFIEKEKEEELMKIIKEENLKEEETRIFINDCLADNVFKTSGTGINNLLNNAGSRFSKENNRAEKKNRVLIKLEDYFNKFSALLVSD